MILSSLAGLPSPLSGVSLLEWVLRLWAHILASQCSRLYGLNSLVAQSWGFSSRIKSFSRNKIAMSLYTLASPRDSAGRWPRFQVLCGIHFSLWRIWILFMTGDRGKMSLHWRVKWLLLWVCRLQHCGLGLILRRLLAGGCLVYGRGRKAQDG